MAQPLPPGTSGGRPDAIVAHPGRQTLTYCKYEEFRAHLAKIGDRRASPQDAIGSPETTAPGAAPGAKEMSLGCEPSPSLAPEDQPSLGLGGGEVAEWFSLFNPAGGVNAVDAAVAAPLPATPQAVVVEMADLVERWVRRVAMGGDQRRGAVRLDIGQGRFSGAEVLVVAEAGHVSVELQLPASLVEGDLSERLRSRLERRGFAADVVVR